MTKNQKGKSRLAAGIGMLIRWLILAAILGVVLWFGTKTLREAPAAGGQGSGGPPPGDGPPPAAVKAAPIKFATERETLRVSGTLRAVTRSDIAVRESGAIQTILVDVGDTVKTGDRLATIDGRRLVTARAEVVANQTAARALVTQREAEHKRAKDDLDMKQQLAEDRVISRRDLLDAESLVTVSAARKQAAKDQLGVLASQLELNDVRKEDLTIVAPFVGRVVARHAEPGEWLAAGSPVVTLVSSGQIEAWLDVPERYAALINTNGGGMGLRVHGVTEPIPVLKLTPVPEVDARSRFFPVLALVDDRNGSLIPGMSVEADLPAGEPQELVTVPTDAVITRQGGTMVYRASAPPDGGGLPSAEPISVEELFRRDGLAYLLAPVLKADDQVVTEGNERLRPGTPLLLSNPESSKTPAASKTPESSETAPPKAP